MLLVFLLLSCCQLVLACNSIPVASSSVTECINGGTLATCKANQVASMGIAISDGYCAKISGVTRGISQANANVTVEVISASFSVPLVNLADAIDTQNNFKTDCFCVGATSEGSCNANGGWCDTYSSDIGSNLVCTSTSLVGVSGGAGTISSGGRCGYVPCMPVAVYQTQVGPVYSVGQFGAPVYQYVYKVTVCQDNQCESRTINTGLSSQTEVFEAANVKFSQVGVFSFPPFTVGQLGQFVKAQTGPGAPVYVLSGLNTLNSHNVQNGASFNRPYKSNQNFGYDGGSVRNSWSASIKNCDNNGNDVSLSVGIATFRQNLISQNLLSGLLSTNIGVLTSVDESGSGIVLNFKDTSATSGLFTVTVDWNGLTFDQDFPRIVPQSGGFGGYCQNSVRTGWVVLRNVDNFAGPAVIMVGCSKGNSTARQVYLAAAETVNVTINSDLCDPFQVCVRSLNTECVSVTTSCTTLEATVSNQTVITGSTDPGETQITGLSLDLGGIGDLLSGPSSIFSSITDFIKKWWWVAAVVLGCIILIPIAIKIADYATKSANYTKV